MKKILLLLLFPIYLFSTSIYDIQFTENAGDGTYPSPLEGQTVTVEGVVSATDFLNGRFFITSPAGGQWQGLYIYENDYQFDIGDYLSITGEVYEYNGFTEINRIDDFEILGTDYTLPESLNVTTAELQYQEANESVLCEIENPEIITSYDEWDDFVISDGSGSCFVYSSFFQNENLSDLVPAIPGYEFEKIVGVVSYQYGGYRLNPRNLSDFYSTPSGIIFTTPASNYPENEIFSIPVKIHFFGSTISCSNYSFQFSYNSDLANFIHSNTVGTLSEKR